MGNRMHSLALVVIIIVCSVMLGWEYVNWDGEGHEDDY